VVRVLFRAADRDQVVEPAQEHQVGQGVPATVFAVGDVVHFATGRGQVTAREPAMLIPLTHRAAQVHRDGVNGRGDVQRQADRRHRNAGGAAAQPGRPPGRIGHQRDGLGEHVPERGLRGGAGCCLLQEYPPVGVVGVGEPGHQAVIRHRSRHAGLRLVRAGHRGVQVLAGHRVRRARPRVTGQGAKQFLVAHRVRCCRPGRDLRLGVVVAGELGE